MNIRPELLAKLALPVNVLLALLLSYELARLSWRLIPLPPPPLTTPGVSQPGLVAEQAGPSVSVTDYDQVADWHLFGERSLAASTTPPPPPPSAAPETRLALTLMGVFFAEDGGRPMALIEGAGDKLAYVLGEELQGAAAGVVLREVHKDKVVLARGDRLETLSLPKSGEFLSGTKPAALPGLGGPPPPSRATRAPQAGAAPGGVIDATAIASRFREAAVTDPDTLQDLAFIDPYVENGQFVGFRLRPGRDRRLLRRLGLRGGDVLTEVNGIRIDDPAKGFAVLQDLFAAEQVSVRIQRNGAEIPMSFQIGPP